MRRRRSAVGPRGTVSATGAGTITSPARAAPVVPSLRETCRMKALLVSLVALVITAVATPAMAYVVVVSTSVAVTNTADDAQVRTAVESAIKDVLGHAIAFTPTIVTLENVQMVGDRLYLMLLVADADG